MRSFIILACLLLSNSALAENATGKVFIDSNKNGVLDTAEQGICLLYTSPSPRD